MPLSDDFVKECRYEFIRDEVLRLEFKYSMPIDVSGSIPETINSKGVDLHSLQSLHAGPAEDWDDYDIPASQSERAFFIDWRS
ncbi:hypothetical protein [Lelliottia sp. JS-SCA-14]|uniref:hypothetical protein n=1 Tax=Lelliottia sp. JS-SCA-14 TaxID=3110110 RepID=UPI002D79D9E0|nr:hypothetical protein [Lelliottia sp. JS-SCA-14]